MHSLGLGHRTPAGSSLTVSSHRSGDPEDLRGWRADNLFRQLAFRATRDVGQPTSAETFEATVAERQDALRSGRLAWSYVEIAVDQEVKVFDVLEVDDAWIAVGTAASSREQ